MASGRLRRGGVLAVLSGRLERVPGPLAHASGLLARSAQGPRPRPAKVRCVPRGTIKSVAALMAQADLDEGTPAAWRLFLAELLRVAQAVHDAHLAGWNPAGWPPRRRGTEGPGQRRARLGSLEALRAELLAVVEPAQEEAGADRSRLRGVSAAGWAKVRCGQSSSPDDNGAGPAETVFEVGRWAWQKGCWDERSAPPVLAYLIDAARQ